MGQEGHILLVMDGACALCSWGARTIARHDHADRFRITTVQSPHGRALMIEHGLDPDDPSSWLLIDRGRAHMRSEAVIYAGRHLSAPWKWLAVIGAFIPRFAREPIYRLIANNRLRWFGREDLCAAPDAALQSKLID